MMGIAASFVESVGEVWMEMENVTPKELQSTQKVSLN
jgi:hypothetical protein